jgi:filamentous hemagglutinin family protein
MAKPRWRGVLLGSLLVLLGSETADAQPIPDETLGNDRSRVRAFNSFIDLIEGGATRDRNLFHSFREFNIGEGSGAYFIHQLGIENIFSRVTGDTRSEINGVLGIRGVENGGFVDSAANLFLINPNGIVFGPNASLDVGGSFAATTADGIQFGDRGVFSATNPELPSQLLTVDPSAFFFNQIPAGNIVNQSIAPAGTTALGTPLLGLRVPDGENLLLLGHDITMPRGALNALGGRVEVGAVGGIGTVDLNADGSLSFPASLPRSDVTLTDGAAIDVLSDDGGIITVTADNINLLTGSVLLAGIDTDLGTAESQAGDLTLNATGAIQVRQSSAVSNQVRPGATGNAGDIDINAATVLVTEDGSLSNITFGQGNAGDVRITATDRVTLDGVDVFSQVARVGMGQGGNIEIDTSILELLNGVQLVASTQGRGNAGNVLVTASDRVTLDSSAGFSRVNQTGVGQAGNIEIDTATLELLNGAQLSSDTDGQGSAGNVLITATVRVTLSGSSPDGRFTSAIFSRVGENGIGQGGNIEIDTATLELLNGAQLLAGTEGQGNAGNVRITASDRVTLDSAGAPRQLLSVIFSRVEQTGAGQGGNIEIDTAILELLNGAQLLADTDGQGNAGNVFITATDRVTFSGSSANGQTTSAIFSRVGENGIGQGGNIEIDTATLELLSGSQLVASTNGRGNAGNVFITASDHITLDSTGAEEQSGSAVSSEVGETGIGQGGNIRIDTAILELLNGAQLAAGTDGRGNAGSVFITASDRVTLDGSSADGRFTSTIFSRVNPTGIGRGGNISIDTATLELLNGAQLVAGTEGQGDAGSIYIDTTTLKLLSGSQLVASTNGRGNAGNVFITASDRITLDSTGAEEQSGSAVFSRVGETGIGRGGNIRIDTAILELLNGAQLVAGTDGRGRAGNVFITASDRVTLAGTNASDSQLVSGIFSRVEQTGIGRGGNISIDTDTLELLNGAQLIANTLGRGNAGNVFIRATDRVTLDGSSADSQSGSVASSQVGETGIGRGGNIRIDTAVLEVLNGAQLIANARGQGRAGNIRIDADDRVSVEGVGRNGISSGLFISTEGERSRRGGTLTVNTDLFQLSDGAVVNAQTSNASRGGNIRINADAFEATDGGQLITTTTNQGQAGNITLNADRIIISGVDSTYEQRLIRNPQVVSNQGANSGLFANTDVGSIGNGGRITVNSSDLTLEDNARISAQSQGDGTAGDIQLNISEQLQSTNSDITTAATRSSGGDITVNADNDSGVIILRGDSDITTNSLGDGGNITLRGSGIVAFDDSDILARSQDARGGNITLAPFFGDTDPDSEPPFDGNDRVDVNADGEVASGTITTPDTSVIQNSLTELPETAINADNLVANSCVVRNQEEGGTFTITGSGGLPQRPGDLSLPSYPTSPVRSMEEEPWQPGEAIVEPQGVYQLEDGRMVLSRECE